MKKFKLPANLQWVKGEAEDIVKGWPGPMRYKLGFLLRSGDRVNVQVSAEEAQEIAERKNFEDWTLTIQESIPGRPIWDEIWMNLADDLSQRSTCKRSSVGCVVVSEDNSVVLGIGYNGGAKGQNNECLSDEPGKCGHLHAEMNALIKTNYRDAAKKKVYVTMEPCYTCAVALVNADVKEVIYGREYRLHDGIDLLKRAGIVVRRYPHVGKDP